MKSNANTDARERSNTDLSDDALEAVTGGAIANGLGDAMIIDPLRDWFPSGPIPLPVPIVPPTPFPPVVPMPQPCPPSPLPPYFEDFVATAGGAH